MKLFAASMLSLVGLAGLLMTVCGGSLIGSDGFRSGFFLIPLIIGIAPGILLMWIAYKGLNGMFKKSAGSAADAGHGEDAVVPSKSQSSDGDRTA